MNTETSAGGLIVCKDGNTWKILLMKDRKNVWTFPKGIPEGDEDPKTTALREIEEEVGIRDLVIVTELHPVTYWYFREKSVKKTVYYFLCISKTMQLPVVQTEEGISEAKWVTLEEALSLIGYPKTNHPLLKEVMNKIPLIQ